MNAHGSGHRGPPPRHPVTGPGGTMCSEGRPAELGRLGPDRRGLAWFLFAGPARAIVRPKGPAVLPARVVGPGGVSHHHPVRPNGPTVPRTTWAMRRIVGPLGRHMLLGAFPGPLGRAGGMAGPLGRLGPSSGPTGNPSIPHISFVNLDLMSAAQFTEFFLKRSRAVVFGLVFHVLNDRFQVRLTDREHAVPRLPRKS